MTAAKLATGPELRPVPGPVTVSLARARTGPAHLRGEPRSGPITLAFLALCAAGFTVRFIALAGHHAPPTVDSGNWLAFGHALLGEHLRSSSIMYPPVVPLLVAMAASAFGVTAGVSLVAALAGVLPGAGVFIVLRRSGCGWACVPLAGLLIFVASTGEAAAWGGFPQLIGLALMPIFLVAVDRWLIGTQPARGLFAGAIFMAILATSDIVAGVSLASALTVLVLRMTLCRGEAGPLPVGRWARGLVLFAIPCVPFAPLYVHLGTAVVQSMGVPSSGARFGATSLPSHVEFLYRDFTLFWRAALLVAVVTPLFLADRRRQTLWVVSTALMTTGAVTAILLREDRYLYVLPTAILLALGAWFEELGRYRAVFFRRVQRALAAALLLALGIQMVSASHLFDEQRRYYAIIDPGLASAIGWLDRTTPAGAIVAVPPIRDAPTGWWVEGMGHRLSLPGSPLRWLSYPDERKRATLANTIFSQDFPDTATLNLARESGASFLLVPRSSDVIDTTRVDAYAASNPASVVFRDATTVVLRVSNG